MIDDLLKSAKETLAERLASPLLGSFAVAWCVWNYKFLVILFSAAGVSQTFKLIETVAFPDTWSVLTRGALYPLLSALLYVFAYPYPARLVYAFTLQRQRDVNEVKRKVENETLLTLEQSRSLRAEYFQLERKNQETVDRLDAEISRLSVALDQAQKDLMGRPDFPPDEPNIDSLSLGQLELLQLLGERGGKAPQEYLVKSTSGEKVKFEFDLGELERRKLIRAEFDQASSKYMSELTHEGRRVFLSLRKNPA